MWYIAVILAGLLAATSGAQTRVAGSEATFGQVVIRSTVSGNINGQPVNGIGSGMLDTTGLFPSTYGIQYDSVVDCLIPITLLPSYLEAESGALSFWQLSRGQFTCRQTIRWPASPGDSVSRVIHSTFAACTLAVSDSFYGSIPDDTPINGRNWIRLAHWTQYDSATVAEQCSLVYIPDNDTEGPWRARISSQFTGLRRQLPTPEVSKTYFPASSYSARHSSITWWGRTMPKNHGRQIDALCTVDGLVNGQGVSGRVWGMVDTTGLKPGYLYGCFESLSVSSIAAWVTWQGWKEYNLRTSQGALNLWDLSRGNYQLARIASFDSGDTIAVAISAHAARTNAWHQVSLSGSYHGPNDIADILPERKVWHQVDASTVSESGRTILRRSSGDSVACDFAGTYHDLNRQLAFDEVVSLAFSKVGDSVGYFALEVDGTVDSATSAISEPVRVTPAFEPRLSVSPSPANSRSLIRFSLPRAGYVGLRFFDATGRLVGTLVQGHLAAGRHNVCLARLGTELKGGIYIARLEADGYSKAVKLVFVAKRLRSLRASTENKH